MSERWSRRVRIPEQSAEFPDRCSGACPWANCAETSVTCNLNLGRRIGDSDTEVPGYDCPGPGWYVIMKEDA